MATFIINNENIYNLVRKYFNGDVTIPPLSEWNTSNVTNMARLFQNITFNNNDQNQNISNCDTSNVTDMSDMFSITQ